MCSDQDGIFLFIYKYGINNKGTIEQIKNQQEEIKTLQLFLMEYNHIFRKLKDK